MRHPSIRRRLMFGSGLAITIVLISSGVIIYKAIGRTLRKEIGTQLLHSASQLAKSSEMEPDGVVYEWHEALESANTPEVTGYFQFWDLASGHSKTSPDLLGGSLPQFHGELNRPVIRMIQLPDGRPAMAVGLLHHPFLDDMTLEEMKRRGRILNPADFPQVLVCARETQTYDEKMARMQDHLIKSGLATVATVWLAVLFITTWSLKPLGGLARCLLERAGAPSPVVLEVPADLPVELIGLAEAFNTTLSKVEAARLRERDFAQHAAHELRTPVAGIQATLEQALRRERSIDELCERIAAALELTSGLHATLNGLMRLARLRGGLESVSREAIDPAPVLDSLIESVAATLTRRRLHFERACHAPIEPFATDPGLFRVLAANLIDNALSYTPEGGTMRLALRDDGAVFTMELTNDRGTLDPATAGRLFEPFQRGSSCPDNDNGHAGLGLSLVRDIAHLLGGRVAMRFDDSRTVTLALELPRYHES